MATVVEPEPGEAFYEALLEVQTELKAPKDLNNDFAGFKYRKAEHILAAVKPLLKKHKLTMVMSDQLVNFGDRYYIEAKVIVFGYGHSLFVTAMAREELSKKGMDTAQITGSTSSYARKYALSGMFGIDDTKDIDEGDYPKEAARAPVRTMAPQPKQEGDDAPKPKWPEVPEIYEIGASLGYSQKIMDAKVATLTSAVKAKLMLRNLENLLEGRLDEERNAAIAATGAGSYDETVEIE